MMNKIFATLLVLTGAVFGIATLSAENNKKNQSQSVNAANTIINNAYIDKIEQFFNNLKTFRADFAEISVQGKQSRGYFVLKQRPAAMRMEYTDHPARVIIVKENKLIYYDKELKEKTVTSIYSSPLAFLMDSKVDFRKNLDVLSCSTDNGLLHIAFRKKNDVDNEYGAVVLTFSLKPFQLVSWEIYHRSDMIGIEIPVQIFLENQKINQNVSDSEFDKI